MTDQEILMDLSRKIEKVLTLLGNDMTIDEYVRRFGGKRETLLKKARGRKYEDCFWKDATGKVRVKNEYIYKLRNANTINK